MEHADTLVTTENGVVSGIAHDGLRSWRGIPYAAPPMGDLRFRAPKRPIGWRGARQCVSYRNAAPQARRYTTTGINKHQPVSEDCLTLNVVAPARRSGPLPVMVFIHGGAYILGSSQTYRGDSLVRATGVVYVSINYRLGALGYLDLTGYSTDARRFDGNLGLRDQIAALQWVQRNIAGFGGDPSNVTVFGESAGGNAVTTLLATPSAAGLFSRAIAQSSAPALTLPQEWATRFAEAYVDILSETHDDPVAALHTATPGELGRAGDRLARKAAELVPGAQPFGPTIDGTLLPLDPIDAASAGRTHPVPLIIGTNRVEANLFAKVFPVLPTTAKAVQEALQGARREVSDGIIAAYPGFPEPFACRKIMGDMIFWAPSVTIADGHSQHAPTYVYRYDYSPRILDWAGFGPTHAMELMAVFGWLTAPWGALVTAAGDRHAARRITGAVQADWGSFAATGAPRSGWPRYDTQTRAVRVIDDPLRVEFDPKAQRRKAWAGYRSYSEVPLGGGIPGEEGQHQGVEDVG